jgi:hypothetical protein
MFGAWIEDLLARVIAPLRNQAGGPVIDWD